MLLSHHGLHMDIRSTASTPIGGPTAGVADLVLEAALSTILDLEDSVAVVDADDKVLAYRNWLGIDARHADRSRDKGGKTFTRGLNPDRATPARAARTWRCTAAACCSCATSAT